MISTSDIVILVAATSALAVGIFRWHENTQDVSAITIPASSRMAVEPINPEPTLDANGESSYTTTAGDQTLSAAENKTVVIQTVSEVANVDAVNATPSTPSLGTHLVRSGDYLSKIAQTYGTDVNTLRELNGISGSVIQIDQEILYPL